MQRTHHVAVKEFRKDLENAALDFIGYSLSDWSEYLKTSSPLWNKVDWLNNRIESLGCGRPLNREMPPRVIFQHINRVLLEGLR